MPMKFNISIQLERTSPDIDMRDVVRHVVEMVQMAEAGGFEIVWIGEHHGIEQNIAPAPFQFMAHLAAHTSRIRFGTAVAVAPYWHPVKLAGEAALFDLLSGGRLEFGIGRGAYQREFNIMARGMPQQEGGAYMREMVPALKKLWQGDYVHEGKYWSFPRVTSVPKPLQRPYPRIWVAARDPASYDWALSEGCSIQSWGIARPFSEVELYKKQFEDALKKHPQTPRPLFMTQRWTAVYDRPDGWEIPVKALHFRAAEFENLFKDVTGSVVEGFTQRIDLNTLKNRNEYEPEWLRAHLPFGMPDEVIAKLKRYEALGVDHYSYIASFAMPMAEQKKSLRLFIDEVMPAFKDESGRRAAE